MTLPSGRNRRRNGFGPAKEIMRVARELVGRRADVEDASACSVALGERSREALGHVVHSERAEISRREISLYRLPIGLADDVTLARAEGAILEVQRIGIFSACAEGKKS